MIVRNRLRFVTQLALIKASSDSWMEQKYVKSIREHDATLSKSVIQELISTHRSYEKFVHAVKKRTFPKSLSIARMAHASLKTDIKLNFYNNGLKYIRT